MSYFVFVSILISLLPVSILYTALIFLLVNCEVSEIFLGCGDLRLQYLYQLNFLICEYCNITTNKVHFWTSSVYSFSLHLMWDKSIIFSLNRSLLYWLKMALDCLGTLLIFAVAYIFEIENLPIFCKADLLLY